MRLAALVMVLMFPVFAIAEVLTTVGFNGVLFQDAECCGFSYDGGMTFRLFDAETGGNQVGADMPIASVQTDTGYYHVELPIPPASLDGPRWLEVTLDQGPALLATRIAVSAVGYAMRAKTVEELNDVRGPDAVDGDGLVTVSGGTATVSIKPPKNFTGQVRTNDVLIVGSERRAVATVAPDGKTVTTRGAFDVTSQDAFFKVQRPIASLAGGEGTVALMMDANGDMGVGGNPSDGYKLAVTGRMRGWTAGSNPFGSVVGFQTVTDPTRHVTPTDASEQAAVATFTGSSELADGTWTGYDLNSTAAGGGFVAARIAAQTAEPKTSQASDLLFLTNSSGLQERMRIESGGNVGIGTSRPGCPLDIAHDMTGSGGLFARFTDSATTAGIQFMINTPTDALAYGAAFRHGIKVPNGESLAFLTGSSDSPRMVIDMAGNVGIGTTEPSARVTVREGGLRFVNYNEKPACNVTTAGTMTYETSASSGAFFGCRRTGSGAADFRWEQLHP